MGRLAESAVVNHRCYNSCSASVLCAFAETAGLSDGEARALAGPMAGGRMGKCGALLAAETVLAQKFGEEQAQALIARSTDVG